MSVSLGWRAGSGRNIASARDRWRAPLDLAYLARKARFVPARDLPYHSSRYLAHRVSRLRSSESRLPTWGPRLPGMDDLARSGITVEELCALQWLACVSAARSRLRSLETDRTMQIAYEDLVASPAAVQGEVASFAGSSVTPAESARMAEHIRVGSVGSWRQRLDRRSQSTLETLLGQVLTELRYK